MNKDFSTLIGVFFMLGIYAYGVFVGAGFGIIGLLSVLTAGIGVFVAWIILELAGWFNES